MHVSAANFITHRHSIPHSCAPVQGLRLVAAIVESKLILGTTIIKSGLQIAGTVVTICAGGWARALGVPPVVPVAHPPSLHRSGHAPTLSLAPPLHAVTVYLMFQWRASKAQQREEAAGAHEAAKGDEELPVGSLREHAGAHGADVASAAEQGAAGPHPDGNRTEAA